MIVELLNHTPLWIADKAIGKCWNKPTLEDNNEVCPSCGCASFEFMPQPDDYYLCNIERIERVALKNKHGSTIEHLNYTYDIDGISRALLQELVRHRHASYSVKSTRYTLKELKDELPYILYKDLSRIRNNANKFLVFTNNDEIDYASYGGLVTLQKRLKDSISNDIAKYCLPEAFKTSLVMTINARSLQNLLQLRTHKSALWEFRNLAKKLYEALPEDHKFLFKDFIYKEKEK